MIEMISDLLKEAIEDLKEIYRTIIFLIKNIGIPTIEAIGGTLKIFKIFKESDIGKLQKIINTIFKIIGVAISFILTGKLAKIIKKILKGEK